MITKDIQLKLTERIAVPRPNTVGLLFLASLAIFLAVPSQQYDLDVLPELGRINASNFRSADPAHMLYTIIGIPAYRLWLGLGYSGDALRPMQALNAVFGAATIATFAAILQKVGIARSLVVATSAAAGLSYGFWTHTEDAFFIIPAAFFSITALLAALLLSERHLTRRRMIMLILALSVGLALLLFQASILIIPALMVASWGGMTLKKRWFYEWALIGVLAGVIAGGVWLYQGLSIAGVRSLPEFVDWLLVSHGGFTRGVWRREGVPLISTTVIAWIATILPVYEGLRLRALMGGQISPRHLPGQFALMVLAISILVSLYFLWRARKRRESVLSPQLWLAVGLWFIIPGLATIWYDRAEVKLWIIPIFAGWLLMAAALNWGFLNRHGKRIRNTTLGLASLLSLTIAISNFSLAVWPNSTREPIELNKAKYALTQMTPNDLVISSSFDWTRYVRFLCPQCQTSNAMLIAQGVPADQESAVFNILAQKAMKTFASGGHVYAVEYLGKPTDPIWKRWITPYTGVTAESFANFDKQIAWQVDGEIVWELLPRE